MQWSSKPSNAWMKYIHQHLASSGWVEDGKRISDTIPLMKRELFALIVASYSIGGNCRVGFDPLDGIQQNDGNVNKGSNKLTFEHKLIAQMEEKEVLKSILDTYEKIMKKGPEYGKKRVLVIQPNKTSDHGGAVRISSLTDKIGDDSPFDQVITLGATAHLGSGTYAMHLIQHYPKPLPKDSAISQVDLDFHTGKGIRRTNGVKWSV